MPGGSILRIALSRDEPEGAGIRKRIMVSPTGSRRQRRDHPALPMTAAEIARAARRAYDAGAGALHLHVRDGSGMHSLDPGRYREGCAALREAVPKMDVQITTESAGRYGVAEQAACLAALAPNWASVALREMASDLAAASRLYGEAAERGTRIQHILHEPGDVDRLFAWQRAGTLARGRLEALFVLGSHGGRAGTPADLAAFLARPGAASLRWMACAFGRGEHACLAAALRQGGRARVGFENNLLRPDGRLLEDNAQSVALLVSPVEQVPASKG